MIPYKELKKHSLTILGFIGLVFALIFTFTGGDPKAPPHNQLTYPAQAPFEKSISGTGLVEANTKNLEVSAFANGIVDKVFVKEGDLVKKGDLLFSLDQHLLKAQIFQQEEAVRVSQLQAALSKVDLEDSQDQLNRGKGLTIGTGITKQELQKRTFNEARARATLALNEGEHLKAQAELKVLQVSLDQLSVRAPQDGLIFKVNVLAGDYVGNGLQQLPPVIMGGVHPLHVRVQIDESDVWRFVSEMPAIAFHRSNTHLRYPLTFVRLEPYIRPKRQLSGESSELVDTRVIEVIYKVQGDPKDLFVGQQIDVYIQARQDP